MTQFDWSPYYKFMRWLSMKLTRHNWDKADDLFQDTMVRLLQKPDFDGRYPKKFAELCMRGIWYNTLRKERYRDIYLLPGQEFSPDDQEGPIALADAISAMPSPQHIEVMLLRGADYQREDIAQVENKSHSAVAELIKQARKASANESTVRLPTSAIADALERALAKAKARIEAPRRIIGRPGPRAKDNTKVAA